VVQDRTTIDATAGTYTYVSVPACGEVVCDPGSVAGGDCKCATHAGASPSSPCWYVWSDHEACPLIDSDVSSAKNVGSGYQIWVDRGTDAACNSPSPPTGTYAVIQCASCIANPSADSYDCSPGCAEKWPDCCPADGTPAQPGCWNGSF
jgi:hypothetical protein